MKTSPKLGTAFIVLTIINISIALFFSYLSVSLLLLTSALSFFLVKHLSMRQKALELEKNIKDLERFNKVMIDRELRMIALKKDVNELLRRLNITDQTQYEQGVKKQDMKLLESARTSDDVKKALLNVLEDLKANTIKIEQEKTRAEAMLESIGDGMIVTDENGKITMLNKSAQEIFGWTINEALNKPFEEISPTYSFSMPIPYSYTKRPPL